MTGATAPVIPFLFFPKRDIQLLGRSRDFGSGELGHITADILD
jgi:hypothetical protein